MGCVDPHSVPKKRIAIRIPDDDVCDDHVAQDALRGFLRRLLCLMAFRRARERLLRAAKLADTVLLDANGKPAALVDLQDDDFYKFSYFVRDFAEPRASDIKRRNSPKTLERRRYLFALCGLAFPEMNLRGHPADPFRIETTFHEPLPDQLTGLVVEDDWASMDR